MVFFQGPNTGLPIDKNMMEQSNPIVNLKGVLKAYIRIELIDPRSSFLYFYTPYF